MMRMRRRRLVGATVERQPSSGLLAPSATIKIRSTQSRMRLHRINKMQPISRVRLTRKLSNNRPRHRRRLPPRPRLPDLI